MSALGLISSLSSAPAHCWVWKHPQQVQATSDRSRISTKACSPITCITGCRTALLFVVVCFLFLSLLLCYCYWPGRVRLKNIGAFEGFYQNIGKKLKHYSLLQTRICQRFGRSRGRSCRAEFLHLFVSSLRSWGARAGMHVLLVHTRTYYSRIYGISTVYLRYCFCSCG